MKRLVAVAAVIALALSAVPALAAEQLAAGWWWRLQSGLLVELPPPPTVPEGTLVVGNAPDGPYAVAAVRATVAEGERILTLTLEVEHEQGGELADLEACPAALRWQPAEAGRWDTRPLPACDVGSVAGLRDEEAGTWTFPVAALADGGVLDVVIQPAQPADAPEDAGGAWFEIAFARPGPAAVETAPAPPPPVAPAGPTEPDSPGAGQPEEESPAAAQAPAPADQPAPRPDPRPAAPPVVTTDERAEEAVVDEEQAPVVAVPGEDSSGTQPPSGVPAAQPALEPVRSTAAVRAAAVAMLLATATALYLARRPDWIPGAGGRGDVAVAAAAPPDLSDPRGLGRFARPRTGPPPPLL